MWTFYGSQQLSQLEKMKRSTLYLQEFDDWLQETLSKSDLSPSERETRFSEWEKAPHSKACHPREEHLIPCHVVLGASLCEKASTAFAYQAMGASCSSYTWA